MNEERKQSEVVPALSADAWRYWTGHDGFRSAMMDVACDAASYDLQGSHKALGALALLGYFTWRDIDVLHATADALEHDGHGTAHAVPGLRSMAARIEALLPPRDMEAKP